MRTHTQSPHTNTETHAYILIGIYTSNCFAINEITTIGHSV